MSLSTDLAEMEIVIRTIHAGAFEMTAEAMVDLERAFGKFSARATRLEEELRAAREALRDAHVQQVGAQVGAQQVGDALDRALDEALDEGREAAIAAGVGDGVVLDYRAVFARELRAHGRPTPPHLLSDNDGDAA